MTGWLLDTNILSAFASGKPALSRKMAAWFEERTDELFLSAITVAEIEAGISKLIEPAPGAGRMSCAPGSNACWALRRPRAAV